MNLFVFDIETVPDVELGRRQFDLEGLSDAEVAQVMFARRRQQTGGEEFLRLHQHRIVAISIAFRSREGLKIWSLGEPGSAEAELVTRFFDGIQRYTPDLVSWNGSGFDLPVLHYRALLHGVSAPRYWETGDSDRDFRYNNYLNRYHARHTDLMDVLAGYQPRANAPLDDIATMLGLPGKLGMSGSQVWERYLRGEIERIRDYCETDVLNTYVVYLRFELLRGHLDEAGYEAECTVVREALERDGRPHMVEFLEAWRSSAADP